jgi:CRISPR-associated endonuclease/helicase Cas3
MGDLLALADSDPERDEIRAALDAILDGDAIAGFLPEWLKRIITSLQADARMRIEEHPHGGLILIGKTKLDTTDSDPEDDLFADAEDHTSEATEPVSLRGHTAAVATVAGEFATRCIDHVYRDAIVAAAGAHDLGKLDWRFQLLLRGGDWAEMSSGEPLAKSGDLPERKLRREEIEEDARLPKGFRHEFLSMQLAEHFWLAPSDEDSRELALHLVASHHGYARPFAPPIPDQLVAEGRSGDICLNAIGNRALLTAVERRAMTPAQHVDSGVADRFWRLTRRYGWWGLAYLEGVFRLSDWEASRWGGGKQSLASTTLPLPKATPPIRGNHSSFNALDGANPLAFLAALGTLRVLTRVYPEYNPRLSWELRLGAWRPLLWTDQPLDEERICDALCKAGLNIATMFTEDLLAATISVSPKNKKGEASWKDKLKFPVDHFRPFCRAASDSRSPSAEFAAAWAGETASSVEDGNQLAFRTRFDFTAGQQAFIGMLRELKETCTAADLQRSLFTGWRYSTAAVSMRWDTQDEKRQYALQAVDPQNAGKNSPMADLGANFLAVEALPLFPLVPNRNAGQAGFDGKGSGRSWSWPIWMHPIGLDVVRSLLAVPITDTNEWPLARRRDIGISTVFQSRIVMPSGRYRCFTPARNA